MRRFFKWFSTSEHILVVGMFLTAVLLIGWFSYYSWFDNEPAIAEDSTFIAGPITMDRVELYRNVIKNRDLEDCPVVGVSHAWINMNTATRYSGLSQTTGGFLQVGPNQFKISLPLPIGLPNGLYQHEIRLLYRCNPLHIQSFTTRSNTFELNRPLKLNGLLSAPKKG